jgi:type II restriction/modification system DNA methylase subunit YeeA
MTPTEFINKWKLVALTERAAAHSHFLDLCKLFEHEDPVTADPTGEWFTFEKGVTKTGGGEGFADVWKRNFFAWEYKKKKSNLDMAMDQLVRYAAALENPPLQVVCDTDRFIVRTAWTNAIPRQYVIELDDLAIPEKFNILRAVFHDPEHLRPKETRAGITKEAADKFSTIALRLQGRGTPEEVAHFVNQIVFCFFANSVKLLPEGFFPKLLKLAAENSDDAIDDFNELFAAMEKGGRFGLEKIAFFNGGLFDGRPPLRLESGDIGLLIAAASLDWSQIDPTIFGTLFERFLDPDKRAQIGAHYTDPDKIMMIVEPVILRPLRSEWESVKAKIAPLAEKASGIIPRTQSPGDRRAADAASRKLRSEATELRDEFLDRLTKVRILDPACGSGNFLYLALQAVKDLENRVVLECEALGLSPKTLGVGPEIVHGIEINPFAAELARTTIWIGDIQWRRRNGIYSESPPILRKLDAIECRDALITKRSDGSFVEAEWPAAEFIVGNPPFLGAKLMKRKLGLEKTDQYRTAFQGQLAGFSDLVCFWFEKARSQILNNQASAVGLVATSSIRGGTNRPVLDRIWRDCKIFDAWSEQPWVIEGARVEVSIICFAQRDSKYATCSLDGIPVDSINPDLTTGLNLSLAIRLRENQRVSFLGIQKSGPHDIAGTFARSLLSEPLNPNSKANSEILNPFWNGDDLTGRPRDVWLIDFPLKLSERAAALFESPFSYLKSTSYDPNDPEETRSLVEARATARDKHARDRWWEPYWPRPKLRATLRSLSRYIVTPETAEYRSFVWLKLPTLPDKNLIVIARDDDTAFGILHSRFHEAWSLRLGTSLEDRPRYTSTTTFETFPFPKGLTPNTPATNYADDPRAIAIAKAAKQLDDLRNAWLNPPDLVRIEPEVVHGYPDRILPKDAQAAVTLKTRTLTNLYNQRPQWLADAHRDLDAAVAVAYGWPADISEEDALAKLLELNLASAAAASLSEPVEAEANGE